MIFFQDILKKRSSNSPEIIFSQEDPSFKVQDVIPDTRMLSLGSNIYYP